jgi:hypothetical protein
MKSLFLRQFLSSSNFACYIFDASVTAQVAVFAKLMREVERGKK